MHVIIARHAEAEHNTADVVNDETSAASLLTTEGIKQAKVLGEELNFSSIDAIYTSKLERAIATAEIASEGHSIPLFQDERLNDIRTGLTGASFEEFRDLVVSSQDPWNFKIKGGESIEEEKTRTLEFLSDLKSKEHSNVLIVTHGGVANIIYGQYHGLELAASFGRDIKNCEWFSIEL